MTQCVLNKVLRSSNNNNSKRPASSSSSRSSSSSTLRSDRSITNKMIRQRVLSLSRRYGRFEQIGSSLLNKNAASFLISNAFSMSSSGSCCCSSSSSSSSSSTTTTTNKSKSKSKNENVLLSCNGSDRARQRYLLRNSSDRSRRTVVTSSSSTNANDNADGSMTNALLGSNFLEQNIEDLELHVEARKSYLSYAMSVIVGRALPDVRDGLKPVHRRILFAMHELGLDHNKPFKKCARVVGEVLGKFHPHGDQSVYDALVRMAQDFSMSATLVNGHGNFGSMDNDPAAAMRYTECKLKQLSQDMLLKDVEMRCVQFSDNFDGSQQEPTVLPAKLPNVLINGSSGIAVGMATSIPPHNLSEVADALVLYARGEQINERVKLRDLLKVMPGPDFPTGGIIYDDGAAATTTTSNSKGGGLYGIYKDGRGSVVLRGNAAIVPRKFFVNKSKGGSTTNNNKKKKDSNNNIPINEDKDIVISSIPYMQNKATLVEQIAELVNSRQIEGVSDVRDESDRDGVRVVVEMKKTGDAEAVLNSLYKRTRLQVRVSCNVTALVGLTPKQLGLMDIMEEFLKFRIEVIQKRAAFSLEKDRSRMHIVEAFLTVLEDTDAVINMIRKSKDSSEARENLREMKGLTTVQSEAVLQMPLRRLTSLESEKLIEERDQLLISIKVNQNLLDSKSAVIDVVCDEALEVKTKHGYERRTTLETDSTPKIEVEQEIPNNDSLIIMSSRGYIKRTRPETFKAQGRGTRGRLMTKLKGSDSIAKVMHAKDLDRVFFFTDKGKVLNVRAYDIPEASTVSQGAPFTKFVDIDKGESITSILSLEPSALLVQEDDKDETFLVMITANGIIKKVSTSEFANIKRNGKRAIALDDGDKLKQVLLAKNGDSVLLGATDGTLILFDVDSLRKLGRMSRGVVGMKLREIKSGASSSSSSSSSGSKSEEDVEEEDEDDDFMIQAEDDDDDDFDDDAAGGVEIVGEDEAKTLATTAGSFAVANEEPLVAFVERHSEDGMAKVAGMAIIQKSDTERVGPWVVLVSEKGRGKRVKVSEFKKQMRGGAGIRGINFNEGDSLAALALIGKTADDSIDEGMIVGSQLGVANRFQCASIPEMGRYAKGGLLMKLNKEDAINSFAVIPGTTVLK